MTSSNSNAAFDDICRECRHIWQHVKPVSIKMFPRMIKRKQLENEEQLHILLKQLEVSFQQKDFKQVENVMCQWLHQDGVWDLSCMNEAERNVFLTITKQFMADARSFDEALRFDDIAQAMRNVWIILILEKVCQRPLRYHKAIFAYSMLYPYTDNLLDDPIRNRHDKQRFNHWLDRRLKGEVLDSEQEDQDKVNALVHMIESYFPRDRYPCVYQSLLHIQNGQAASLLQYDVLDEEVLLDISITKGGASVLADGFLMDGTLRKDEQRFCVHFGFLLQLADDIQDLQQDHIQQYHTMIGVLKDKNSRRAFCEKYLSYVHQVISEVCPNKESRLCRFIEENCRLLIYFSLQQDAAFYPSMFMHHIRERLPIRANEMKKLMQRLPDVHTNSLELLDEYLALS